jgi:AcrR family transcriptional regulator
MHNQCDNNLMAKDRSPVASTRERILDAALELFLTQGEQHVTMRQIAAVIGVTPMTIYRHFEDKEALQLAVLDAGYKVFGSYLDRPTNGSPLDALREMSDGFFDFAVDNSAYFELIFLSGRTMSGLNSRQSVRVVALPTFELLADRVKACQHSGELPGTDANRLAADLLAVAIGNAALHISGLFAKSPASAKRAMKQAFARYLEAVKVGVSH